MIRLDISKIPDSHIMTRWTRRAKDVIPEHLKGHQIEVSLNKPLVLQSMQLNAKALEAISKGNTDTETLEVVMKHLNAAIKEVDGIIRARRENIVSAEVPVKDKFSVDSDDLYGTQTDVEAVQGNCYGAAGSSAHLSDTEILKLRAPIANRPRGRPRANRFRSPSEPGSKKVPDNTVNTCGTGGKRKSVKILEKVNQLNPRRKGSVKQLYMRRVQKKTAACHYSRGFVASASSQAMTKKHVVVHPEKRRRKMKLDAVSVTLRATLRQSA